jgi:hypothetical protein
MDVNIRSRPQAVAHVCNPSYSEAKIGKILSEANPGEKIKVVPSQPKKTHIEGINRRIVVQTSPGKSARTHSKNN